MNDHTECLKELLDKQADPNQCDKWCYTSLMAASLRGHVESLKILLENKADPNKKSCPPNDLPKKAIDLAEQCGHKECVKILKEYMDTIHDEL